MATASARRSPCSYACASSSPRFRQARRLFQQRLEQVDRRLRVAAAQIQATEGELELEVGRRRGARLLEVPDGAPHVLGAAGPGVGPRREYQPQDAVRGAVVRVALQRLARGGDRLFPAIAAGVERGQLGQDFAARPIDPGRCAVGADRAVDVALALEIPPAQEQAIRLAALRGRLLCGRLRGDRPDARQRQPDEDADEGRGAHGGTDCSTGRGAATSGDAKYAGRPAAQQRCDILQVRFSSLEVGLGVDPELLAILACPDCKTPVVPVRDGTGLKCERCRRVYPIKDDIPVMLIDEATIEA